MDSDVITSLLHARRGYSNSDHLKDLVNIQLNYARDEISVLLKVIALAQSKDTLTTQIVEEDPNVLQDTNLNEVLLQTKLKTIDTALNIFSTAQAKIKENIIQQNEFFRELRSLQSDFLLTHSKQKIYVDLSGEFYEVGRNYDATHSTNLKLLRNGRPIETADVRTYLIAELTNKLLK